MATLRVHLKDVLDSELVELEDERNLLSGAVIKTKPCHIDFEKLANNHYIITLATEHGSSMISMNEYEYQRLIKRMLPSFALMKSKYKHIF